MKSITKISAICLLIWVCVIWILYRQVQKSTTLERLEQDLNAYDQDWVFSTQSLDKTVCKLSFLGKYFVDKYKKKFKTVFYGKKFAAKKFKKQLDEVIARTPRNTQKYCILAELSNYLGLLSSNGGNWGNICGDKQVGNGETCDDWNRENGDGCSASCQLELPVTAINFSVNDSYSFQDRNIFSVQHLVTVETEDNVQNLVLTFSVPQGACVSPGYMWYYGEFSYDNRTTWTKNTPATYAYDPDCAVTDIRVVYPKDNPNLLSALPLFASTASQVCVDYLLSADNAQYVEKTICTTPSSIQLSCVQDTTEAAWSTYILWGNYGDIAASRQMTATGEPVIVEEINIAGTPSNLDDSFEEVTLLAQDMVTELATEFVSSSTVSLQHISWPQGNDYVLQPWSETVHLQLKARKTNTTEDNSEWWPFLLVASIDGARGQNSHIPVRASCQWNTQDPNDQSILFEAYNRAVLLSQADFVAQYQSTQVATELQAGIENTLAIFKISADAWTNKDPNTNQALRAAIQQLTLVVNNNTDGELQNLNLRRIWSQDSLQIASVPVGLQKLTFDADELAATNDFKLESAETAYYVVVATPTDANEASDSVRIDLEQLRGGNEPFAVYRADYSAAQATNTLSSWPSEIQGITISWPSN